MKRITIVLGGIVLPSISAVAYMLGFITLHTIMSVCTMGAIALIVGFLFFGMKDLPNDYQKGTPHNPSWYK